MVPSRNTAPELESSALRALTRARSSLVLEHPFFGSIALRMELACDAECRDLWADGRTLACNPVYAANVSEKTLVSAVAHEVLHIALGHHVRRGERDETLWNKACDYAVNCILVESGFPLPDGAPYRKEYTEKSVDDIYKYLAAFHDDSSHSASTRNTEGEETSSVDGEGSADLGGEEGQANESRSGKPKEGDNSEGRAEEEKGGKASDKKQGRERDAESSFSGEVRDHPLLKENGGDDARRKAEEDSDIAMVQAAHEALRMGDMPAGLTRLVRRRIRPMLDWREQLSRFLEQCSDSDYSWTTPDRRYVHQGLYLPSRREAKLPEIVLAIDCSGSVDEALLARFCTELSGLLEAYDATLHVLYHDIKVNGTKTLTRQDMPFTLTPLGGGGTDYRPVPQAIDDMGMNPACVLWFTDLECDRFPEEPAWPVLWVTSSEKRKPPFGDVLLMPHI